MRSFLGHAKFYSRFIEDFNKISSYLCNLLCKDVLFVFDDDCAYAFEKLKYEFIYAPIIKPLDWNLPNNVRCL